MYNGSAFSRSLTKLHPMKLWLTSTGLMIFFGSLSYGMYNMYILQGQKVSNFYWLPEIFILTLQVIYLLIGFALIKNRYTIPRKLYHSLGLITTALWFLLISTRIAEGYSWIFFVNALFSLLYARKQAYEISNQMQIARDKNWLRKNLDEKEWTWHYFEIEIKGKEEAKKQKDTLRKFAWVHGLPQVAAIFISRYLGIDISLTVVSITTYFLSTGFLKVAFEGLGMLHRLKVWEVEMGKPLILNESWDEEKQNDN